MEGGHQGETEGGHQEETEGGHQEERRVVTRKRWRVVTRRRGGGGGGGGWLLGRHRRGRLLGRSRSESPEADSGRSAYQASDRGSRSQSEERREYSNRSGGASPARARNLIGMGLNPREWSDGDGGIGDRSPGEREQLTESRMEEVREWMEERGEWNVFENRLGEQLGDELATAREAGIRPLHVDDAEFMQVANRAGQLNWAVTGEGELLFAPQWVGGDAIAHTVLTEGSPVVAAGEAEIIVNGDERLCIDITRLSGHYQPDERSLDIGVQAFKTSGITFVNEPREYGDGGEDPCHFACAEEYDGGEYDGEGNVDAREELMRLMRMWESREAVEQDGLEDMRQYDGSEYDGGYSEVNNDIDNSNAMAQEGPIKWVVLERSQLLTDPSLVANTVLTASEAVIAAGDYIDVVEGNERFCIEVAADSGNSHIEVTQEPEVREVADGNGGDHDGDDEPSSNRNEAISINSAQSGHSDGEHGVAGGGYGGGDGNGNGKNPAVLEGDSSSDDEDEKDGHTDAAAVQPETSDHAHLSPQDANKLREIREATKEMWQMLASRERAGDEGQHDGDEYDGGHGDGNADAKELSEARRAFVELLNEHISDNGDGKDGDSDNAIVERAAGTPSVEMTVINVPEIKAPNAIKSSEATQSWENYLGENTTNIHPRTNQADPNRIFSADGTKSIRFGNHEMARMGTPKFHYHMETWTYDPATDTMVVTNTLQRIKR